MRPTRCTTAALLALAIMAMGACGDTDAPEEEAFCTLAGCLPSLTLDASASLGALSGGELCIDDACEPVPETTTGFVHGGAQEGQDGGRIRVSGRLVAADGAEVELVPSTLALQEVFPNGEGCEPSCWGAEATVGADGTLTQVEPRSDLPADG
jgi:hypothetical protein